MHDEHFQNMTTRSVSKRMICQYMKISCFSWLILVLYALHMRSSRRLNHKTCSIIFLFFPFALLNNYLVRFVCVVTFSLNSFRKLDTVNKCLWHYFLSSFCCCSKETGKKQKISGQKIQKTDHAFSFSFFGLATVGLTCVTQ